MFKKVTLGISLLAALGPYSESKAADPEMTLFVSKWTEKLGSTDRNTNPSVVGPNQCAFYHRIGDKDHPETNFWIYGMKNGESIPDLSLIKFGGVGFSGVKLTEAQYDWNDNVIGYALTPGCSLIVANDKNFSGPKEIVLPGPDITENWTGTENASKLIKIEPLPISKTRDQMSSISCQCFKNTPSPLVPDAELAKKVHETINGQAQQALASIESLGATLKARIIAFKEQALAFDEQFNALKDPLDPLDHVTDTNKAIDLSTINAYEAAYRPFAVKHCSSQLHSNNYQAIQNLIKRGQAELDIFQSTLAHYQDANSRYRLRIRKFRDAQDEFDGQASELEDSLNSILRGCQLVTGVLKAIPERQRYEKLSKLNPAFAGLSEDMIKAVEDANRALALYSVKMYWDAEFRKRLNTVSGLRLKSHFAKTEAYHLELDQWFGQLVAMITTDPSIVSDAERNSIKSDYQALLQNEVKLWTTARQVGVGAFVRARLKNRFNNDLIPKVRRLVADGSNKQELFDSYRTMVANNNFVLPASCTQAMTSLADRNCWTIALPGETSTELYSVLDRNLDKLEAALTEKFSIQ